jgi:hypothetical protein
MGVTICSPKSVASQQGYNLLRGLGKHQQGGLHPVQPSGSLGRTGLGHQAALPFQ